MLMVMAAVAMVVVAVAVIQARIVGGRTHLVGFEQSDTEQQGKRHVSFHRPQDPRIVLDVSELLFDSLKPLLGDEVALVQQQDVAINHLGPANFRVQNDVVEVFCIDQGDDRIQAGLVPQLTAKEGHGHRQGIGQTGGFDDDVIERFWAFNHPFHRLHQLVVDRAADATVAQLHHVFIGGDDQIVVDADFTELIHQHRGLHPLLIAQDVIQQRGFSRSEEAAENGDRDVGRWLVRWSCARTHSTHAGSRASMALASSTSRLLRPPRSWVVRSIETRL